MKDMYSFHLDENDFQKFYDTATEAYKKVFYRVGIEDPTYLTYASGGTFSKYSHEFQTLAEAGEDTIYLCENCKIAVNKEIRGEVKSCPKCGSSAFVEKRAIEVGNIFPLKTRFSDAFGLTVKDAEGRDMPIIMGCYGIGLSRLMGAVAEIRHDDKGLIWPESVAPFRVHLVELAGKSGSEKVKKSAEKLYKDLLAKDIEVLYDDRDDKTPGEKFADADLIGIPWRVVVSEKTLAKEGVELKSRSAKDTEIISKKEFWKKISISKSK